MASSLCLYAGDHFPFLTEKLRQRDAHETKEARIELKGQYEVEINKTKKSKSKKSIESRKEISEKLVALEKLINVTQRHEDNLNETYDYHNDGSRMSLEYKVKNGDVNLSFNRLPSKERVAQVVNFEPNSAVIFFYHNLSTKSFVEL